MADSTDHRGTVQAQGGGNEESVSWAQSAPPSASDGWTNRRRNLWLVAKIMQPLAGRASDGNCKPSLARPANGIVCGFAHAAEGKTQMVQHLCKNFLADAAEYESAEARWRRLWDGIVAEEGREAEWQVPWFAPEFANGTPMRDGNPIFSAVSPRLRRGVRIIQHEPTSDELELEPWLDTFQGEEPIAELVISCALSSQAEEKAAGLIRSWIAASPVGDPFYVNWNKVAGGQMESQSC